MLKFLKSWMLVLAMVAGALLNNHLAFLTPFVPYLIGIMLFLTFSKISFSSLKITRMHYVMLAIQIVSSIVVYCAVKPFSDVTAEGLLICVLVPSATSASVIVGILGGKIASIATYVMLSSTVLALVSPVIFSLIGTHTDLSFAISFAYICKKVLPLILLPMVLALIVQRFTPAMHKRVLSLHGLSFYLWGIALTVVVGNTFGSLINNRGFDHRIEFYIAAGSLILCIIQFAIGRKVGIKYGEQIVGQQGLGQKNTILAIWLAQTYLSPISALAPASYVIWQNCINSFEVWKKRREK